MNIHKSDIEWCSHTWNPVTGCKHGCEYCYARRIVSRFGPHPCERPIIEPLEVLPYDEPDDQEGGDENG